MAMVLFMVGMAALTSCHKDYESKIIGKWKFYSAEASYGGQSMSMTIDQIAVMYGIPIDSDEFIIEFKNNGYVYADGDGVPYSIDGDKVTITSEGSSFSFRITELTYSKMSWRYTDKETGLDVIIHLRKA